jgi:hypothetical protein
MREHHSRPLARVCLGIIFEQQNPSTHSHKNEFMSTPDERLLLMLINSSSSSREQ